MFLALLSCVGGCTNSPSSLGAPSTEASSSNTESSDDSSTGAEEQESTESETADEGERLDLPAGEGETGPVDPTPTLGSCRLSEIYGAAGGFPAYEDPLYADFDGAVAIATCKGFAATDYVLGVVDISGDPPPPNQNYAAPAYHHPMWTVENFGRIFGLTLNSRGDIFTTATSAFNGGGALPNSPLGGIHRVDAMTGEVSLFIDLPNLGPALGNINYDCVSESLYVSNHDDGRIYQIDADAQILSTYHHGSGSLEMGPPTPGVEPDGEFAPLGERVWAVQSHAGRLYYGVWVENSNEPNEERNNEVWSVAMDPEGTPMPETAKFELAVPDPEPPVADEPSQPVSDISFSATGWMLVAERTMWAADQSGAHNSWIYEYRFVDGSWIPQGMTYVVGEIQGSSAGGVDHDFAPGGYVWMTGDALDFGTPDFVYGLQGTPHGGGLVEMSTIIDLDGEVTLQDKTDIGDVELPIPGDAEPVPPPVG